MTTWEDDRAPRPLTIWDKLAGLLLLWSLGALCGGMLALWLHDKLWPH